MAWTAPVTQSTGTLITAAIWNAQVTDNMTYLKTLDITGMIVMRDTDCPAGWTRVSALDSKFIRGAATYNAAAGGSDTHTHNHTHTGPSHTHDANLDETPVTNNDISLNIHARGATADAWPIGTAAGSGSNTIYRVTTGVAASGTGATGADASAGSTLPAYANLIFCKKD